MLKAALREKSDSSYVKTVRFSQLVKTCGPPELHLALIDPAKDAALQKAVQAHRVLTVFQETVGQKTDRGEVGLKPGVHRQYLIFPKSLRAHEGKTVVGIKYDLVGTPEIPKSERAAPAKPAKATEPIKPAKTLKPAKPIQPRKKPKPTKPAKPKSNPARVAPPRPPKPARASKIVPFKTTAEEDESDTEVTELKAQVRKAIRLLEDGKQVAAFHLLQRALRG